MSYNSLQKLKLKVLKSILIMFYEKVVFLFGIEEKSFKNKEKINFTYTKNFLKIFPKLILTNTMRHSHQKNYSTALRKLTASAIGSVF